MTLDELAKEKAFQDAAFVSKLQDKIIALLRDHLRMIQHQTEVPRPFLVQALVVFVGGEIKESLSAEHAIALLRKIADGLEASSRTTVQ
jgi:hypothetical protein